MIHVFHGFLGSPEDFSFLKREDVVLHDLYAMATYPEIGPEDTLIGYSMGGRVALDIARYVDYRLKKIVLINAHPGLNSDEERAQRTIWESSVIKDLSTKTAEDFINDWNELPIFFHDQPLKAIPDERYLKSAELFQRYRLSNQVDHLPLIVKNKDKVLWIVGLFDEKYMDLASEYLLPYDVTVKGVPGGHRLFQEERSLLKVLTEEGIL